MEVNGVERCCDNCTFEEGEFWDTGHRAYYACEHQPCPQYLKNFKPENGCSFFKPRFILTITKEDMDKMEQEFRKNENTGGEFKPLCYGKRPENELPEYAEVCIYCPVYVGCTKETIKSVAAPMTITYAESHYRS